MPPNTGIVHQVNIEHLARVVFDMEKDGVRWAYPDTLVGTDSHTTMVNGLGVLGWGVGGIEAEAAMLGQPVTMLIPHVIGFKLIGSLPAGTTATDLVLTVTEMLRKKGVVDKFVEFFGDGLASLPLADRATIGNMSPEFGSTCAIFPVDEETLRYLELTGRSAEHIAMVKAYAQHQGMWRENGQPQADYTDVLELDLGTVEPSLAGPEASAGPRAAAHGEADVSGGPQEDGRGARGQESCAPRASATRHGRRQVVRGRGRRGADRRDHELHEHVEPRGADRRRPARAQCAQARPDCEALGQDQPRAGLARRHRLSQQGRASAAISKRSASTPSATAARPASATPVRCGRRSPRRCAPATSIACSVLSGNRNFEGRVHPEVKMNFLASPPLVVAYALAGTLEPRSHDRAARHRQRRQAGLPEGHLADAGRDPASSSRKSVDSAMFKKGYASVFTGDENWNAIRLPSGKIYAWDDKSTYVKNPPYFVGMTMKPGAVADIRNARVLALLGDSVTTDHISPAGDISKSSPAAKYLMSLGVQPVDFNSYGARRGNHEVMMRGTFANIRLRNQLAPGTEGGVTVHVPSGEQMSIYDAAMRYKQEGTPLVVLAGKEYGTGSSRDWAAKGTMLLGVKAVIAESFERIHRSNLIGMGVLPLQFKEGQNAQSLGLTGKETFEIIGLNGGAAKVVTVVATPATGAPIKFEVRVRIDTPKEREYFQHGGILHYVLRQLASSSKAA